MNMQWRKSGSANEVVLWSARSHENIESCAHARFCSLFWETDDEFMVGMSH